MTVQTEDFTIEAGGHAVHFYEHDVELAGVACDFLAEAIDANGMAVVIATEEHRRAFERELSDAGPRLLALDAEETLAAFTPGGQIDAEAFDRVIGDTMRDAVAAGGPVHAFGEMVAILWDEGQVLAAIELEKLWGELQLELPFSLLCAYRRASVSDPSLADAVQQVCHLHSHVLTAPRQEAREFAAGPGAPRAARRFVADALRQWGHSDVLVNDAQLVVSELATNAVIHAHSPFSVLVRGEDAGVRLSVADQSPAKPELRNPSEDQPSGRGLHVVSALTSRWGVDTLDDGKSVWAHLPA